MSEDPKNIKEAFAEMNATKQQGCCPSCGYCPHCGRRDTTPHYVPMPYYPPRPYYTEPYWQIPGVWCGSGGISQGTTTETLTLNC